MPKGKITRPKYVQRWLTGAGVPNLKAEGSNIHGLSGLRIHVGSITTNKHNVIAFMSRLSQSESRYINVVPSRAGEPIQDSIALVRLDFLAELLAAYVEKNGHRLFGEE